jgi:hypothetical protein
MSSDGVTAPNPVLVDALLQAGSGDERVVSGVVDTWGPGLVGEVLLNEVLFRCEIPYDCGVVLLGCDLRHRRWRGQHVLRVADSVPVERVLSGWDDVGMRIEYEITDLVRELFGPPSRRFAGTNATELVSASQVGGAAGPSRDGVRRIGRAAHTVLSAIRNVPPDLGRLALRYASDKWGAIHRFTPHYERHFRPLRDQVVRVLEIGIGGYDNLTPGGGSLKMWKRYFNRGRIYGVDIFDKSHVNEARIQALRGRQDDRDFLRGLAEEHGPFDIVIDDGSHINEHVRASFEVLFPYVRNGGFYVIEDLWTSYLPGWGGDPVPGASAETSLELVKALVDALHHEERSEPTAADHVGRDLVSLHVYHNIVFLEKGVNREGGIPPWIPRAPFWEDTGNSPSEAQRSSR